MNRERLETLRDFLRNMTPLAREHFNMERWAAHRGRNIAYPGHDVEQEEHPLPKDRPLETEHLLTCGTTACALGWAATIPAFRAAGLELLPFAGEPAFGGRHGVGAGALFFDITIEASELLFATYTNRYITPDHVAQLIDFVIAADGGVPESSDAFQMLHLDLFALEQKADFEECTERREP